MLDHVNPLSEKQLACMVLQWSADSFDIFFSLSNA